ncbi:MAG: FAD-dependent oxidoreductase [Rickettsiales bacterium]
MSQAITHRYRHIFADIMRGIGQVLRFSERVLAPVMDLIRRISIAQAFFISGALKLGNWDTALYLAANEYPLSWIDPVSAAYLGVAIEIICPVLLVLGLMTRFAALPLLILTAIAQIAYHPVNAQAFWIIILGYWVVMGAGRNSLDHLLRGLKDTALPLSKTFSYFFAWLTRVIGPIYLLGMRLWIAAVLYVAGHAAMESMSFAEPLQFLEYQPHYSVLRTMQENGLAELLCGAGALLLALGFGTRLVAAASLVLLAVLTQDIDASSVQETEFVYWFMLLTILFFRGPGALSLDHIVRLTLGKIFPQLDGMATKNYDGLPHVVIVGAGFGGVATARMLRTTACRITLVDKHNYHLFQPLLYQVATAGLSPSDIATPIRGLFRDQENIRVMMNEVTGIDKAARHVKLANGKSLAYDYLVLATGARHSYFGKDAWSEFAPGMKRVEDAIAVRGKLLRAFEAAENTDDAALREKLLSFVIVGGGPTGVELAGALAELAHQGMEDEFRRIDPANAKIYLVEAGPRVLAVMPESISTYTQKALEKLGVTVKTGGRVETIDADGVVVNGERIASLNVIWAAGVQASPAAQWLGGEADRAGRLKVNADLSVPNCPGVYAIGDTVLAEVWKGKPMPGLAPAAKQSGQFVAKHIRARIEGSVPQKAFHYRHYGSLATIGRKAAVADFGKVKLQGALAWWFWGAVHVLFLANLQSRVAVMVEWFWAYLTFKRSIRLITDSTNANSL